MTDTIKPEIERFDPIEYYAMGGSGTGQMKRDPDGEWVEFEEYQKLATQLADQSRQIAELRNARDMMHLSARTAEAALIELRVERDQLRSDLAAARQRATEAIQETESLRQINDAAAAELSAARQRIEALEGALGEQDRYIISHNYGGRQKDSACDECYPGSEDIVAGFVCAYHRAMGRKAALSTQSKATEQSAFEEWLYRYCPSGDETSVRRQWMESSDYIDFCAESEATGEKGEA